MTKNLTFSIHLHVLRLCIILRALGPNTPVRFPHRTFHFISTKLEFKEMKILKIYLDLKLCHMHKIWLASIQFRDNSFDFHLSRLALSDIHVSIKTVEVCNKVYLRFGFIRAEVLLHICMQCIMKYSFVLISQIQELLAIS